jgi:MFS family permease
VVAADHPVYGSPPTTAMKTLREIFTHERAARPLLIAHVQSSLGSGAAYVALLLIAYERFDSALAVSAILLCEFVPAVFLGALMGAVADRWPRRTIMIAADILRAGAFVGLALVDSFAATVALAALAGVGQAAFNPSVMASLPTLVSEKRLPAAMGVWAAIQEVGYTVGPMLAAATFAVIGAAGVLLANGVTFAISALLLCTLRLPHAASDEAGHEPKPSLITSARDGARALRRNRAAWTVVVSSSFFVCFFGAMNVAEVLLVNSTLHGGKAGYAIVTTAMSIGIFVGSLVAARGENPALGRRLYLGGIALCALGMAACAVAPVLTVAVLAFVVIGLGNGMAMVSEGVLIQQVIPAEIRGRAFGLKSAMISGAFLIAYFGGGLLVAGIGPRGTFALIAAGSLAVCLVARVVLATERQTTLVPVPA